MTFGRISVIALVALMAAAHADAVESDFQIGELPAGLLVDQNGRPVDLAEELSAGKPVALNFIFTSCGTVCPPMGAVFGKLQHKVSAGTRLLSLSVDPGTDTPGRLRAWGARFEAGPKWRLLTGDKQIVDRYLKSLGVFTPVVEDHAPVLLIGNPATRRWMRTSAIAAPDEIAAQIIALAGPTVANAAPKSHAGSTVGQSVTVARQPATRTALHDYLTDVALVDQHGQTHQLYSDLVAGRSVVINTFFGSCKAICPVIQQKMAAVQRAFGERIGTDLHILSVTVDPDHDTPQRLGELAASLGAREGWYFLTGEVENVQFALTRLGYAVDEPEAHKSVITIGNDHTGLWKKAHGIGSVDALMKTIRSVVDDQVAPAGT